jgi:hypothetical protein
MIEQKKINSKTFFPLILYLYFCLDELIKFIDLFIYNNIHKLKNIKNNLMMKMMLKCKKKKNVNYICKYKNFLNIF